jgi:hypothetical protein
MNQAGDLPQVIGKMAQPKYGSNIEASNVQARNTEATQPKLATSFGFHCF